MNEETILKEISELFDIEKDEINIINNGYIMAEIEAGNMQITAYESYEDAEERAKDLLIDEPYFWKMAVKNDSTTQGLEGWADDVIRNDGITSLCTYDGDYQEGEDYIYIRTN
jgi:hypothetical protein